MTLNFDFLKMAAQYSLPIKNKAFLAKSTKPYLLTAQDD
jgi:hypothetical protein